ncbi:MAG: DUF1963 domain-containing protein [Bacteroidales bacterium]|nr:DUF1963 domain-containing protein [Bacteroidales bacterium]
MAIKINLAKTERILFCGSKWWGDPDMPADMQYPTVKVEEDGDTFDYPLTFICQINCEDIAAFDKENLLPHEGMLYFFGAIDSFLGYDSPTENSLGEWPKGYFIVKYAKEINMETFQTCMMVDDDDQTLTEPELEIIFSECEDTDKGIKILGLPANSATRNDYPDMLSLFQLDSSDEIGLQLGDSAILNFLFKQSDLHFCNWKRGKAVLK